MKQSCPPALLYLEEALSDLKRRDVFRERPAPHVSPCTTFCSNDYLGLGGRFGPPAAAGASASRLVVGEHAEHITLERLAARLVAQPASLVFTSGYAANVGLLSALAGPADRIVSDAFNHASIIDGARLSKARTVVVPHLDLPAVERALSEPHSGRSFVVTESYFSMDADQPDLARLRAICDARGAALVVDEAHALGVLGPEGRGLCVAAGVRADALVGTFGKAFGAAGAFVAGCDALMAWLWNRARTFVFSTGLSPALAAAASAGITAAEANPALREMTLGAAHRLREGLHRVGIRPAGFGHIIPWVLGPSSAALRMSNALRAHGLDVRPIRPPSVPAGTARLRFTVTAAHGPADIDRAIAIVGDVLAAGAL
ncbi:MAG: aminotransferase class I/II-fold pyridoxal phosphate-dependent enzyme [Polyangiaceae bacterium]